MTRSTHAARWCAPDALAGPAPEPLASVPPAPALPASGDLHRLTDRDLLARLLMRRDRRGAAMADLLLGRFGALGAVVVADPEELARTTGGSATDLAELGILRELAIRLARAEASRRPAISSWSQLTAYVRAALADLPCEQFRVLYLDKRNALMRDEFLAEGTIDHAPVYPREVVRRALALSASALILVHNHPSGDPTPSRADIEMTRKVIDACRVFDLQVHDHLVIAREGITSFRSQGLI